MDDAVAFHRYHHAKSPAVQKGKWIIFACFLFAIAAITAVLVQNGPPEPAIFAAVVGTVVLIWLFFARAPDMVDKQVRAMFAEGPNKAIFGPREIEITQETITERSRYHEHTTRWTAVEKIVETPNHAFIYWCGVGAHAIPRAQVGDEAFRRFIDESHIYYAAANPAAPSI